jgi:hypothetical protein
MENTKFPSIEQFRSVIKEVKHATKSTSMLPVLNYRGTIKAHGTHADVVLNMDGTIHFQSRNLIITKEKDNMGFAAFASMIDFTPFFNHIKTIVSIEEATIIISGEWCGGNIQKGVALTGLPTMWLVYGVKVNRQWMDIALFPELKDHAHSIYHILEFQTFSMEIDFNHPEIAQNKMVEITNQVEKECPIGRYFGVLGVGEGIVWTCLNNNDPRFIFKVKGKEHSVTKVKQLVEVNMEVFTAIDSFVEAVVTQNRLTQGIDYLKENQLEPNVKNMGPFLRWVSGDVIKEEKDRIQASGLAEKELMSAINKKSKEWFLQRTNDD